MKRFVGVNTCESTGVFALDWSLWVVRDLSCYLVHHLVILSRPDPPRPTELAAPEAPCPLTPLPFGLQFNLEFQTPCSSHFWDV